MILNIIAVVFSIGSRLTGFLPVREPHESSMIGYKTNPFQVSDSGIIEERSCKEEVSQITHERHDLKNQLMLLDWRTE